MKGKGKKRALESGEQHSGHEQGQGTTRGSSSSLSPTPASDSESDAQPAPPSKKRKRAETRPCPVCHELIPLRLIPKHTELEMSRVETIIRAVGETEVVHDERDNRFNDSTPQHDTKPRRSAARALRSFRTTHPSNPSSSSALTKSLAYVSRRRKARYLRLKDLAREDDSDHDSYSRLRGHEYEECIETTCPVCLTVVRGDEDVVDAHVDACLAYEAARAEQQADEELDVGECEGAYVGNVSSARGTDFHIRDRTLQDVDDDIDVDGEDEFGDAQFTEGDILRLSSSSGAAPAIPQQSSSAARSNQDRQHRSPDVELDLDLDIDVELTDDDERTKSLRDLVAAGKIVRSHPNLTLATSSSSIQNGVIHEVHDKINIREEIKVQIDEPIAVDTADLAIARARRAGDERALIRALESKVAHLESSHPPPTLLCRICLDAYTEPTASTGCWHTCCRECWLRCLGTTRMCPICKRITVAGDLRRVYL